MLKEYSSVLITGATSGIGEELAKKLASKSNKLLLTGRNKEKLQSLSKDLSQITKIETKISDLKEESSRKIILDWIEIEKPTLVINSAGFGLYGEALSHPIQETLDILKLDGEATLEITLKAADTLLKSGTSGTILNISSAAGFLVFPKFSVYAATKAFVTAVSQSLYYELKDKGISVLAFCPGVVATNFRRSAAKGKETRKQLEIELGAADTADAILRQIENKKPVMIYDWRYRFLISLSQWLPKSWQAKLMGKSIDDLIK